MTEDVYSRLTQGPMEDCPECRDGSRDVVTEVDGVVEVQWHAAPCRTCDGRKRVPVN